MFKKAVDATKNKEVKADSYVKTDRDGKKVINLKKSHADESIPKNFKNQRREAGSSVLDRLNKRDKEDDKGC